MKPKLKKREMLGGPFDGEWLAMPDETATLLRVAGHTLHRYDLDEIVEGKRVRQIYRHSTQVPLDREAIEGMVLDWLHKTLTDKPKKPDAE